MEQFNPIILAIPIFFILIGVELLVDRLRKTELYRFNDGLTNISLGLSSRIFGVFLKTFILTGYIFIYNKYKLFEIPDAWWSWLLLFVGVDFFYYWFHRFAHEISLFWGTHIVHHQSEEYNFSVALRQSSLQPIVSNIFYLPLALIGFNPVSFVMINAFQTLYQFWIHTKLIGKMHPIVEFLFNTPSHHRVHHGINPKYIDKNHGGTFIVFDRLFGTFQEEEEEVVYGVTDSLSSWNPLWANMVYYADLHQESRKMNSLKDKFLLLVKPPGWRPAYMGGQLYPQPITPKEQVKFDTKISSALNYYVIGQYLIVMLGALLFLLASGSLDLSKIIVGNVVFFWSLVNIGGFLENKKWAFSLDLIRHLVLPAVVFYLAEGTYQVQLTLLFLGLSLLSLLWLNGMHLLQKKQVSVN